MVKKRAERPNVKFVGIRLDRGQKSAFEAWLQEVSPNLFDELTNLVQGGHKLGVSWDYKNTCFIVSLTCWADDDVNYSFCFSTRHGDLETALLLTVYKAVVVLLECAWEDGAENDDWG